MRLTAPVDAWFRRGADAALASHRRRRERRRAHDELGADAHTTSMLFIEIEYFGVVGRARRRALCDELLHRLSLVLPGLLRQSDVTYREDRSRLCVLLPDTAPSDAELVAVRLRRAIETEVLPTAASVSITVASTLGAPTD